MAIRAEEGYEQKYEIPREDWDWALRGKDKLSWKLLQEDKGPPASRPLVFNLTLYMDKFRRGMRYFFPLDQQLFLVLSSGETASYGMTNGVYASCSSFGTVARPMATLTLLHSSIPLSVIGDIMREQQQLWVGHHNFEFAYHFPGDAPWPRDVAFPDRIQHPNGRRYVVQGERSGYIFWGTGQGDLPVYRENSGLLTLPPCLWFSAPGVLKVNRLTHFFLQQSTAFTEPTRDWLPRTRSTSGSVRWTRTCP